MKYFVVSKSVLLICLALAVYYLIMEFYYVYFVTESFLRFGFHISLNWLKYIESKIIFVSILVLSFSVFRKSEFIYSVFVFFIIFFLVPSLVTYSFSDQIRGPVYSIVFMIVAIGLIASNRIKIPLIKDTNFSYGIVMLMVLVALIPIVYKFGLYFNLSNLFLEEVYNTREYFDENASQIINYIYNWLIKAIVPICMIYFFINKRYIFATLSFLILLYLYIISGNKLVYITTFVMLFFYFFGKDYLEKTRYVCIALILGLLIIIPVDYFIFHRDALKGVFVMRMLFLPSYLNYYYFDFFRDHSLYFAESHFFNLFTTYPYDKPIGYIIAQTYFNVTDMNANNGIIGDGFMNLGYSGVGLSILIVSFVFLFFNSVNVDSRYLGLFFVMIFLFLSLPLLSMFVTSGLWIVFLLSMTMMRKRFG